MRFFLVVLIFAASASSEAQQDLLECVDQDVVTAFLQRVSGFTRTISRDLPDEFTEIATPSGFLFIGGEVIGDSASSVAYKTAHSVEQAGDLVITSLKAAGWQLLPERKRRTKRPGFQTTSRSSSFPRAISLCRDKSSMQVSVREEAAGTYVLLGHNRNPGQSLSCSAIAMLSTTSSSEFLPVIDLPPGVRFTTGGGSTTSRDYARSRVGFNSKQDSRSLFLFFGDQLEQQDWVLETQWETNTTSGSVWSSHPDEGIQLGGTLQIVQANSNAAYVVVFSLELFESAG